MKTLVRATLMSLVLVHSAAFAGGKSCPADKPTADIVETAVGAGQFKTLAAALGAAGLVETLKGEGPFTVFAPTDEAFAKLPAGTVEGLLNDIPALTNILLYHVAAGDFSAADLVKERMVVTVQGQKVAIEKRGNRLFINNAQVIAMPVKASNGIIYVIDTVLLP